MSNINVSNRKPANSLNRGPLFSKEDITRLTAKLQELNDVLNLSWEFFDNELVVHGFNEKEIVFTHPKSARAYLDGFTEGYNLGYRDGCSGVERSTVGMVD